MRQSDAKKIDEALSLLNEVAQDKKKELREMITEKYGNLKQAIVEVETEVAQNAKQYKDAAADQVKDTAHRVDSVVHADPWKALGWAAAGAFALGYLFGHKK